MPVLPVRHRRKERLKKSILRRHNAINERQESQGNFEQY
jgi:hypothetical protein